MRQSTVHAEQLYIYRDGEGEPKRERGEHKNKETESYSDSGANPKEQVLIEGEANKQSKPAQNKKQKVLCRNSKACQTPAVSTSSAISTPLARVTRPPSKLTLLFRTCIFRAYMVARETSRAETTIR